MKRKKKKLYIVRLVCETVVVATDEDDAAMTASAMSADILDRDGIDTCECVSSVESPSDLPPQWKPHCIPWGEDNDESIDYILRSGGKSSK